MTKYLPHELQDSLLPSRILFSLFVIFPQCIHQNNNARISCYQIYSRGCKPQWIRQSSYGPILKLTYILLVLRIYCLFWYIPSFTFIKAIWNLCHNLGCTWCSFFHINIFAVRWLISSWWFFLLGLLLISNYHNWMWVHYK